MLRKSLQYLLVAVVSVVVLFVVVKSVGDARYFVDYDPALPADAQVVSVTEVNDTVDLFGVDRPRHYKRTEFTFAARADDRVPCVLTQPASFEGKLPTIVFVHGSGQSKNFVEEICTPFNKAGFAMVSYDQWGRGGRKLPEGDWRKITAWYDRGWKATNDARRLVDYLLTRDDVDPERIYLVGASYGAMTGTHILAHDKRFKAGVLVVGGGNFNIMLDAPLIRREVPAMALAVLKPIANWLGKPFDPIRSAPDTAPTPILMQNGSDDILVSPEAGEALFAALAEPKEILWYKVDHPGLRDGDGPEIVRMLDEGLVWLQAKAGMPPAAEQPAPVVVSDASALPAPE